MLMLFHDHYLLEGADMKKKKKRKQQKQPPKNRQLDLSDRIAIEVGICSHTPFKEIARQLGKHPSTISREVRLNTYMISGHFYMGNDCKRARQCKNKRHMCGDDRCLRECVACRKWSCHYHCDHYVKSHCSRYEKPPYVCNNCSDKKLCNIDRYIYSARHAQQMSEKRRSESRQGVHLTKEERKLLNEILTPRIKGGQPLAHIYEAHKDELPVSLRSLYNYIDQGELEVKNIDLRRKVRYKRRRKRKDPDAPQQQYRINRTYDDFILFMAHHTKDVYAEMDTVVGARGSGKRILTMFLVKHDILLMFLMPDGKAESVKRVFEYLEELIGIDVFNRLFPAILTDNGSEFKQADDLEVNEFGEIRTNMFYCDPMASWQKPHIEKAHEYLRYVLPKGTTFKNLTQDDVTLLMNHINSVKRPSLKGKSPYENVRKKDKDLHLLMEKLKMHLIPADEVHLTRDLLR